MLESVAKAKSVKAMGFAEGRLATPEEVEKDIGAKDDITTLQVGERDGFCNGFEINNNC